MKKQNIGLGLLLMGNIVAQFPELAVWLFGAMLGIADFWFSCLAQRRNNLWSIHRLRSKL